MSFLFGVQVIAYLVAGVQLSEYLPHIVILFVGAWFGTFIGTQLLKKLTDDRFKTILKFVLTALAIRLIILNGYSLLTD